MTYLFLGYTVIWTAIFLYILSLHRRLEAVRRELKALDAERGGAEAPR
ncbi:MAG: CcmD family protein [Firmicutes bacterium]|nr:CcmD family protein [Bacillota bacterium]